MSEETSNNPIRQKTELLHGCFGNNILSCEGFHLVI